MKSIYKIIGIIVVAVALVLPTTLRAADAKTTAEAEWKRGIEAYSGGDYAAAVEAFEHIVALGEASADVYYNLGDAYFKLGQQRTTSSGRAFAEGELGRAILNYHRALVLNPAMEDARYNLDLARDLTNDTTAVPLSFAANIWLALRNMTTTNGWTITSIVALALCLTLTLLYLLSERIAVRKVSFFLAVLLGILFILATVLAISGRSAIESDRRAVVICNDSTPVHASPDSASKVIRRPSQGVTITRLRDHDSWCEVLFADGEKGWIRGSYIEMI